jgi:hypothetical protein
VLATVHEALPDRGPGPSSPEKRADSITPSVRANDLDAGVMDLIRRTLVTPKAVRQMVQLLNEDIRMRAERRTPDVDEANARIRKLQDEDANLRRALRSAGPKASDRIGSELETVAAELETAQTRLAELDQSERPLRSTTKLVQQTIDDMNGILDHAPSATQVAWMRDLFDRIDVDSRDEKAVAIWMAVTDEGVNRSIPYTSGSGGRIRTYDQALPPVRHALVLGTVSVRAPVSCTVRSVPSGTTAASFGGRPAAAVALIRQSRSR